MPLARRRGPGTRSSPLGGVTPLPLPSCTAVGVTNLSDDGAVLVGSINPQGLTGNNWFAYGTTPAYGQMTPTTPDASTGQLPITVTATITGLQDGQQYWFAVVCQTAAGTVYSAPGTFTPQNVLAVTDATQPLVSYATPDVTIPHFAWPFQITSTGAAVVQQASFEEIVSNVQTVVACPIGACPELPTFGRPDLTFLPGPVDPSSLIASIQHWEPRADETAIVTALNTIGDTWQIALSTGVTGT